MPTLSAEHRAAIDAVLLEARHLGFLGPGPVDPHIEQALGFASVATGVSGGSEVPRGSDGIDSDWTGRILDLGSGGGVPGLVVALALHRASLVLLDANQRRTDFLVTSVDRLGLQDRVTVVRMRAEEGGRDSTLRGAFDRVLARSFAPPAVTAECAAAFLRVGGYLVVSEPPGAEGELGDRWPASGLSELGMSSVTIVRPGARFCRILQHEPCPFGFPRRVGVPAKRPLF